MALLVVALGSAWMVGDVKFGGSQGLVFADNGSQGSGSQDGAVEEDGGEVEEGPAPDPGSPDDDSVNAGTPPTTGATKPAPTKKPAPTQPPSGSQPEKGTSPTKSGPVSALDREFLSAVSLAAQWQIPTGADASKRAANALVKDAAQRIAFDQFNLDTKLKSVATALEVELPAQPTAEQQAWMTEISKASGKKYDQLFVDRTRNAQGKLFPLVSQARANTQNNLIRTFAQTTSTVTLRNMTFLERTGLVGPGSLPGAANGGDQGTGNTPPANPPTGGNTGPGATEPNQPDPNAGGLNEGDALLPGDNLGDGDASGGGTTAPSNPAPPNNSTPNNPSVNAPTDPLDLPQGNPAENQAGSVATTPTSSILGAGQEGTGKYVIIGMLVIAGLIFLTALRGFYRRPR